MTTISTLYEYIDLLERLRSLARMEHSDLSIGDEAADAIVALCVKIDRSSKSRDYFPPSNSK